MSRFHDRSQGNLIGLPEAQYNVGDRYFRGVGTKQNYGLATEYWKMAAAQGFRIAQVRSVCRSAFLYFSC